jgi:hypothetical protein
MKNYAFSEVRVRSRISEAEIERVKGQIIKEHDIDLVMRGPTILYRADGKLLAKYLPGALLGDSLLDDVHQTLYEVSKGTTDNRGLASGYQRAKTKGSATRTRTPHVSSSIIGSFDPQPPRRYCRLTAFSGRELDRWQGLFPLFQRINGYFKKYVPERYSNQEGFANRTHPDWRIADTVFTTVTVNRSYPTGVHTDSGDLDEGFSTLAVLRRGSYTGGTFAIVAHRIGVDMQHGDLLLMDAHEWHGNTAMFCSVCGEGMGAAEYFPDHTACDTERISVVSYYRSKMAVCGSADEEAVKARDWAEHRIDINAQQLSDEQAIQARELAEMAAEAG